MSGKSWTSPPKLPAQSTKELDVKLALMTVRNAFDPRNQIAGNAVAAANNALLNLEIEIASLRGYKKSMDEWIAKRTAEAQERLDAMIDHSEHGTGNTITGPTDPDCPCRNTKNEAACAVAGCGFCKPSFLAKNKQAQK